MTAPELVDLDRAVAGTAPAFWSAFGAAARVVGVDPSAVGLRRVTACAADARDRRDGPEPVVIDLDWAVNPFTPVAPDLRCRDLAALALVGDWSALPPGDARPADLWNALRPLSWGLALAPRARLRHFGPWSAAYPRVFGFRPRPPAEIVEWARRFANPHYVARGVRGWRRDGSHRDAA